MKAGIVVSVTPQDRVRLEAIVADRNTRQKHAASARVIVATADGCGTTEVMRRSALSKPVVWRWRERFRQEGVDGLLRDKTCKPGKPPLPAEVVRRVIVVNPHTSIAQPAPRSVRFTTRAKSRSERRP